MLSETKNTKRNKYLAAFLACLGGIVGLHQFYLKKPFICIEMNMIKKYGAQFSFEENNIAKGRDAIIGILKNNKSLYDNLVNKINNSKI